MARVETLAGEAKHERANRLSDAPDPEPVLRNLRRLNHDLTAVGRAVMTAMPAQGRQHLAEPMNALRHAIVGFLTEAAEGLRCRPSRRRPSFRSMRPWPLWAWR